MLLRIPNIGEELPILLTLWFINLSILEGPFKKPGYLRGYLNAYLSLHLHISDAYRHNVAFAADNSRQQMLLATLVKSASQSYSVSQTKAAPFFLKKCIPLTCLACLLVDDAASPLLQSED